MLVLEGDTHLSEYRSMQTCPYRSSFWVDGANDGGGCGGFGSGGLTVGAMAVRAVAAAPCRPGTCRSA